MFVPQAVHKPSSIHDKAMCGVDIKNLLSTKLSPTVTCIRCIKALRRKGKLV